MGQHERFLERLMGSIPSVLVVAGMQIAKGRTVEIPGIRLAQSAAEAEYYVDGGDLFVLVRHRFEVKHLGKNFSCADDWPHPHVFVSNVANGEVIAYVSVSHDLKHAAIIERATRPIWYVVDGLCRNTGNVERNYACPIDHVIFEATGAA